MVEQRKPEQDNASQAGQADALIRFFHQTPDFVLQPLASTMIVFEDHMEIIEDFLTELRQGSSTDDLQTEVQESVDRIRQVYPVASRAIRGYWQVFNAFYEVYANPSLQGEHDVDLLQEAGAKLAVELEELRQDHRTLEDKADRLASWLAETQARLVEAERLASVGRLSFGVGHDLRNTLATAINSGIPLRSLVADMRRIVTMLNDGRPREEISDYIARRQIRRRLDSAPHAYETMMSKLAQALDNVKALEGYAVQDGSDFRPMRIEDAIERVLTDHREDLTGIRVETAFAEQSYDFKGNHFKIYDVFQNLILNAIEAMQETETPVVRIVTRVGAGIHRSVVEDNGCGMSEEVQKHAFEPFYTTKGLAEGRQRGMGLFNVWRLVEQHGGDIEVQSTLGQHTRFQISFKIETRQSPDKPAVAEGAG